MPQLASPRKQAAQRRHSFCVFAVLISATSAAIALAFRNTPCFVAPTSSHFSAPTVLPFGAPACTECLPRRICVNSRGGHGHRSIRTAAFAVPLAIAVLSTVASRQRLTASRQSAVRFGSVRRPASGEVQASPQSISINPSTCYPVGKPEFVTEYQDEYDISHPKESFIRVATRLNRELVEEMQVFYETGEKEVERIRRSLEYNTLDGKMNRGLIVVETCQQLMQHHGKIPSNRDLNRFAVLGWAVELLQACMVMADDIMDGAVTRRGRPCWFRLPNIGVVGTIDFLLMEMFLYKLLKRHFGQDEWYGWLVDLFLEITLQTECGQLLDSDCINCTLSELTMDRWTRLVKYKTAFYSFYLPVAIGMIATGFRDQKAFDIARDILLEMGIYFQAQDDYLDAFASPEESGKIGTDIQDKKGTWLLASAYQDGDAGARALLDKHYGKCGVGSDEENLVKDLYESLGLKTRFRELEDDTLKRLERFRLEAEAQGLPWSIFDRFFAMIFRRRK
eukprot:TRINITY_DN63119_c0_g1_i1.p1 TRINITY_DN63119_c0_g1~~TRINITY_DN63119_c0_g1_i1.p1  ORF type:complete len:507 (-),score=70.23 TRINITY_DN63119_c0_g1_i1:132-1652(-)